MMMIIIIIIIIIIISKPLKQYLNNIPGKYEIKGLPKRRGKKTRHIGHRTQTAGSAAVTYFTREITLHVAQAVTTEQLQHCIH